MISAGYDAAIGCPEVRNLDLWWKKNLHILFQGEMLLTPGFYSHIIQLLSGVADGRIVMVLEGGYFIPSLSESAALSVKGLLSDPCPLLEETGYVQQNIVETINNCKGALYNQWNCFSAVERFEYKPEYKLNGHEDHIVSVKYFGEREQPPFTTRGYYPEHSQLAVNDFTSFITNFQNNEGEFSVNICCSRFFISLTKHPLFRGKTD